MLRRAPGFVLAFVLCSNLLFAQGDGERELALGKDAFARQDHVAALEHLARATGALDPERDREPLADAYLHLGLTYLAGLNRPEQALAAFLKSAEQAANPASAWLWASAAAERLGRGEEAARYKAQALPAAAPETLPSVPAAAVESMDPAPKLDEKPKPDAFQHFFGRKAAAKPEKKVEKEPEPSEADAKESKEEEKKADAFDYFFGKGRQKRANEDEKDQPAEKPPAPR